MRPCVLATEFPADKRNSQQASHWEFARKRREPAGSQSGAAGEFPMGSANSQQIPGFLGNLAREWFAPDLVASQPSPRDSVPCQRIAPAAKGLMSEQDCSALDRTHSIRRASIDRIVGRLKQLTPEQSPSDGPPVSAYPRFATVGRKLIHHIAHRGSFSQIEAHREIRSGSAAPEGVGSPTIVLDRRAPARHYRASTRIFNAPAAAPPGLTATSVYQGTTEE